jgi:hypothetical protein
MGYAPLYNVLLETRDGICGQKWPADVRSESFLEMPACFVPIISVILQFMFRMPLKFDWSRYNALWAFRVGAILFAAPRLVRWQWSAWFPRSHFPLARTVNVVYIRYRSCVHFCITMKANTHKLGSTSDGLYTTFYAICPRNRTYHIGHKIYFMICIVQIMHVAVKGLVGPDVALLPT